MPVFCFPNLLLWMGQIRMDTQNLWFKVGPIWDAELRVWDAKNFGPVSPGTHRNKFVKKSLWICKTIWIFFYVFPVTGSGGVPYLKIVNFQSSDIRRNTEPGWKNLHTRLKIDLYSLTFINILKENLLQMVREGTIKINLYAQKRIPSIAIKNS